MAKIAASVRLPESTHDQMKELSALFKESGSEVVERAINYLYINRKEAAKADLEARLSKIKGDE